MRIHTIRWIVIASLAACASQGDSEEQRQGLGERTYSHEECRAAGGVVRGDIGDGATQRPDYVCPSGQPPLGVFRPLPGEPIPTDGAVCCPR